ncbi:MAG TPA: hypothetical protein VKD90_14995 [Gemmataceae bacterium]|nr:hypothetical protein [Gemmataceae bacterium]
MLTISGKALGQRKPLFADYAVPIPPAAAGGEAVTLRDLIAHVVRTEVAAFTDRQAERRLLKALSPAQIAAGLAKGKVEMGGSDLKQEVDPEQAVGTALQAFEDGIYLVVLDGEEQKELDRQVFLTEESRVAFIRLAMLAGG